jgi:1-deoxy-D-xylulose-5-phosphate synthase
VTSIYATFLQRAFDNLFHDICLQELPVIFAIDRAGISGPDGSTHHGIYDISFLNAMPNMVISQPRNGQVLKELMESAFNWKRPAAIRYPNLATEDSDEPLKERELGKGEVLIEGKDILIIALGHMNNIALKAHALLAEQGFDATVLDPVFIKPLDSDLLCRLLLTHQKIVTIEEHCVIAGMGAIINNFLIRQGFSNIQVLNLGIPETFLDHGSHQDLLSEIGLTPEKIVKQVMTHFGLKGSNKSVLTTT